jgi:hypothetical protein
MSNYSLDDYVDVAERIRAFRELHPTGSLQRFDLQFIEFGGKAWVVYTAAAYRSPDDERPGIGTAWEPVPGATNFTRNSEVQNAETAAWGRAIVAALAGDTKKVASRDEVRMRTETAEKATSRDFIHEAEQYAAQGNLTALQDVYKSAKTFGLSQSKLDVIILLGQKLKDPTGDEGGTSEATSKTQNKSKA